MGVITLEGLIITVLVLTGLRTAVVDAIPLALKRVIGVGIGLFILFIGLYSGGLVKQGTGIPVTLGDLTSPATFVAIVSVALTTALMALGFRGALLVGIVLSTGWPSRSIC
jgi:AGZA family xanthine/uracil permease-like MFS transporter